MNPSSCLPIKEIVEILAKRAAALEAKRRNGWTVAKFGNLDHALDSALRSFEHAEAELNRWG